MKNILLSFTKKIIAVFIILELCSFTTFAGSGIFESYVIVQANGGSANYYDLFASTGNPDFQGLNFGTFTCTNSLVIKGGQNKTYKNGTDNILNGYLYYRVYKNGSDPNLVSFTSINLGFDINLNGSGDQQWTNAGATANVLQGLADGTYTIEVYSSADFTYNGGSGTHYQNVGGANYKATFTVNNPINITTQPLTPAAFCSGTNVTLTAAATGADAYFWQEDISGGNWSNISGANGSMNVAGETVSLTLTNLTTTKKVRCLFTNCGGINTLATSEINLIPQRPTILLQPISQTDCDGNTVDFTITASTGSTFVWQRKKPSDADFLTVSATTNSVITSTSTTSELKVRNIGNTENPHLSIYRCVVSDANSCSITSNQATLSVNSINNIADSPAICAGGSTSFLATFVGTTTSIKWQKGTVETTAGSYSDLNDSSPNILGTTTNTLSLSNVPFSDNNTFYRVRAVFTTVTNSGTGTCTKTQAVSSVNNSGKLVVNALPTAPTANSASRCEAGTVTLSATSALNANESFRWYETNVSTTVLGTATNYTTTSLAVGTYTYYLSVYNSSTTCESTRTPVTVTVNALPTITFGSVTDICNSATSFSLPFSATTGSPNQYSISVGSPALSGFSAISNATLGSSPIDVTIPVNATANTYQFIISVKNSSTTCVSTSQTFTVKINDTPAAPTVTSSINYCQNAPTTILSATASGTNTLLWYDTSSSGGTSSLTAPTPSSTVIGTTSYYVSQKNTENCESSRAAINVIINAIPNAPSTTTAVSYCKNSTATVLTATAVGSNSLIWYDENDNILGAAPTPSTTTVGTQIYKVSQKSPSPANCESPKTTITVTINDLPPAPTFATSVGYCQNATAIALAATAFSSNTLLWYGTSAVGGTSSGTAPTPITTSAGTTSYYVSQKDANNCESLRAKIDVEITPSVSATITGINAFCITGVLNNSTTLSANPTGGNGTYTYQWQNLAGNIASATSQTFEANSTIQTGNSDTYKVTVTSRYCTATANLTVTKQGWADVPNVSGNTPDICGNGTKTLIIVSPSASGTYKWFTDATTLTQTSAGTSFLTPNLTSTTTYYVAREQQITANLTCQTVRTATTINVNVIPETPTIVNSANKTTLCNNESGFTLSVSCTSGSGQYRLNNGSWTNGSSVTITPSSYSSVSTLNYDFKCSLSASCESGLASTSITINPVPNAPTISGNTSICLGSSTTLTASGCSGTVVWSNGTSDTSIIVSSSGTYNATCTVNGCVSLPSTLQTIVVNSIPAAPTVVSDDADNIVCAGTNIKLSVSDCAGTVVWSNGTSATSITVSLTGTYNATCTVNACTSPVSATQNIVVNQNPSITLGSINSICNAATTFDLPYSATTNSPDKYSLTSTMPDFVAVAETNLPASPILVTIPSGKTGTYSFTLNIKNSTNTCLTAQNFNVTVLPLLTGGSIETSSSTINCSGYNPSDIASVTLGSGGKLDYVYQWQLSTDNQNFTDITGANLPNYNPPAITQTTYYRRKITDACGVETYSSNVHQVQIVADPQITLTDASERVICSGGSISLEATVIGGSGTCTATWQSSATQSGTYTNEQVGGLSFSTTLTNSSSTPLVKYYKVIYACSGTGSSACGQATSTTVKVTVNYIPIAPVVSGTTSICAGASTILTASGCTGTINWNTGAVGSTISVNLAGTYSATCTQSSCTSNASNIHTLTVNPIPSPPTITSDDADNTVCDGTSIVLTASDCAGTVIWSDNTIGNSITVSLAGTYNATCTVNNCVSSASALQTITVNPIPNAPTLTGNTSICSGNSTILTASSCGGTITWNTGTIGSTINVITAGTYNATCTINNCVSIASEVKTVVVNSIPNAPTISGNTQICQGLSTTLTASGCVGIITWSTGATGSTISASVGTYTATCTENSCVSSPSSLHTISENGLPTITLSTINNICNAATSFELAYSTITNNPDKYSLTSTMPDFVAVSETSLPSSPITVTIPSGKVGMHTFTLVIKNSVTGCVNSQTFNATILPVLVGGSIEVSPITINCAGYNAGSISSVSLASGGKTAYVYQWQSSINGVDFTDLSAATSTTYDPAGLTETTYFRRKVTDGCGAVAYSSNIHQITIVPDPAITISSDKMAVCAGGAVNFSQTVLQAGTGTCTTTWKSSSSVSMTSPFTEGTGSSLLLNLNNSGTTAIKKYFQATYDCSVSSCNNAVSNVIEITINPNPSVPTISGGGTICSGSSTTLTASGCNGNLLWSNGATSTSIDIAMAGSYSSVCTNSCGTSAASNEIVVNVTSVNPPTLAGTTTVCSGQSATLTATGCAGIVVWSNASSGTSITVSPSTTTSYTATCTANSCTSVNSALVTVTVAPSIDFTVGSVADLCNSATSFSLLYNLILGSPDKYTLNSTMAGFTSIVDGNLGASPISVTIPSNLSGTFSFTLTLKISSTGCSKSQTFNVNILPSLSGGSIETSSSTINCSGYNAGAISSVSLASGGKTDYVYQWQSSSDNVNFSDISGANLTTYDPPALTQTTYYRRKVIDACGAEAISSNVHQIQIVPDPQITITDVSDRTICSGGSISLEATVIGGSGTCTPTWQSSSTQSGTYTNEQVGGLSFAATLANATPATITKYYRAIYACSGTGSGSCNQGTSAVVKVTINPNPSVPTVSGGGIICSGSSTTLTASGCNGNLLWSNTATSTSINVSLAGSYSAVCTNSCGTSAASNEIVVNVTTVSPPTLTGITTVCSGQSATLTATGCAGTVVWSNALSGTSITVSPSTTTSYTATCTVNGCTSVNSELVMVTVAPSIDFTVGSVVDLCNSATSFSLLYNLILGSPDKYTLNSTMAGFTSIVDGNLGASPISVTIPSNLSGTFSFTLTLKISSTGCSKSQTFNVNILPSLSGGSIETSSSTINCSGYNAGAISSVSLASGGKTDYVYQWQSSSDNVNFSDISGANLTTYDPPALTQTTYYRRKVTDACGAEAISSNVHQIQIVPDPQITITDVSDRTICSGGSFSLEATVIGGSGTCTPTWQSSSTQSGTYTNKQVGGLSFAATLTNFTPTTITKYYRAIYACSGTGSGSCNQGTSALVKVIINSIPNAPIITPTSVVICPTQSTTLTASGCGGFVTWNGGQTGSILSVSEAGTYAATCTVNSCVSAISSSATVTVASGGTPVAPPIISGTATICSGQFTNLTATNCSGLVTWSDGKTGMSVSVNPSISTDYTATCFDGTCTSNNSNKITVTVNSYPNITTQPKNEVDCNGNSVTFSVTASSATSYQWQRKIPNGTFTDITNDFSNSLTISNVGGTIDPNQTEYRVVVSNGNCGVTSTVAVLTVNSVVGSLADQTICDGGNISFNLSNVSVTGNIQSYQWQRRVGTSGTWNDIVGATTTTLTINAATNADEQYYRCKVNFTAGSSTCARYTTEDDTNGAKLTVLVASTPTVIGINAICKGTNMTLTANNCDGIIAWSSGQSTATITVSPTANTSYTVSCTSVQCGFSVTSSPYLVTVNTTPQPEIITYDVITPATLTFAARTTVPNATLMWYNRASGGTGTTTAPSFSTVGTYSYWVTQTDPITGCESARLPIIAKVLDYFHIINRPTNQVDCKGNSVFLGVVAVGPNPLFTYQWQRKRPNEPDFVNLVEETNGIRGWYAQTMAVSNVGDVNNPNQTQYRCIVSNNGQSLTSEISTLTVNSLEGSMPNLGICVGATNEFNLQNYFTITGNVMSYQWQTRPGTNGAWTDLNDGNGISGSNKSALKFTNATYEQGVYYRCLVKFNTQGFECTEPTDAAKLIVSGFPPAPSISNVFYCQNTNAVRLKVDSPIQNLVWYSQEIGGAGNTTAPTPNTSVAGIFKYYVADRTDEGCEGPRATINVEVGATPSAPKNTTPISINEGNILTFSAEGTTAENQTLRWYTSPTITTFSTTSPTFTAAGTYTRYVAQVSAFGCVSSRTAITATIIPSLKFTKQPVSQADCDGNSVTFTVSATAPSTFSYQWQRQKPNETSFTDLIGENANTLKISNIGNVENPNLTKYRCTIKDDKNTSISEIAVLTVNQILGTLATMSLCDGKASKLSFSSLTITGNVTEYQWQKKVGTSYTDIPTYADGIAIINEIGTYRGKITFVVDKTTTCNRTTEDLKAEVKPSPVAPQVANQSACQNATFDITKAVSATNPLLWYESVADSTADKITPKIDVSRLGTTTFFVSQINTFGCESERKLFEITVSLIPEKPITSDLTYCRNAPSLALGATTSPQNQVVWYASLTAKDAFGQTPTPNTKTDGETIYFAAAKNAAGCESERVPLKVSIAPCIATFESNFNNCLQVSADSVKGNQWYDLYDKTGRLYASINPNGLNLGKVSISIRHYGHGSAAIPATKNDTKLMARYVDFQSSLLKEFNTPVSLRIYYENNELNDYKTAVNLPNLTINDFNIVHYDGVREDCGFENNDNFSEGESYVIYKNVIGNQIAKDFFYLQFDVNEFSENGATANDFTEITFSGKETENQIVQLNWQSKYEIKAEKYILERSADCKNFIKIGEVKANGTSSIYENIDFQPLAGKSCYRLVYIDKDGTKKYLDAIEVNFTNTTPICSVFPNPWTKGDEINLYLRNIKERAIKLYDMRGQELSFNMNKNEAQIIKIHPDVYLSKGIHFVVVVGEDGKKCVQKVVINP